jgi:hypothetical protein
MEDGRPARPHHVIVGEILRPDDHFVGTGG